MKLRIYKLLSLVLCAVMLTAATGSSLAAEVTGIDVHGSEEGLSSRADEHPQVIGILESADDVDIYEVEIDHSICPEAILYAFIYDGAGGFGVTVSDETGKVVGQIIMQNRISPTSGGYIFTPKSLLRIENSEGATKTYTIKVFTTTPNIVYAFNLGTEATIAEDFGGIYNLTTVQKNIPPESTKHSAAIGRGFTALLDTGEWFRYTADGYTYITAEITNETSIAFEVYDIETGDLVYQTTPKDRGKNIHSEELNLYSGYVQKGLDLEPGKDYLIRFYSTSPIAAEKITDFYNIYIGLPAIALVDINVTAPSKFYVPANTTKTFTIDVNDTSILSSARLNPRSTVSFSAGSSMENSYVSSCVVTAPNGQSFVLKNGKYSSFNYPNVVNYLASKDNIPVHGTWTVKIRTTKSQYFTFGIRGMVSTIQGNSGN